MPTKKKTNKVEKEERKKFSKELLKFAKKELTEEWQRKRFVKYYLKLRDATQAALIMDLSLEGEVYLQLPEIAKEIAKADYKILTGKTDVDFVKAQLKLEILRGTLPGARLKAITDLVKFLNIKPAPEEKEIKVTFEDLKDIKKKQLFDRKDLEEDNGD